MQKRFPVLFLVVSLGLLASCTRSGAQATPEPAPVQRSLAADSIEAHAAAQGFLAAFDSLQFDRFRGYFADEVTMFFPFPQFPARVNGREAVEEVFGDFMTAAREGRVSAGRPTVLGITARDLILQMVTHDVAVVSFHLGAEDTPARRSIVFGNTPTGWKVVHWHASSAPPQPNR